MWNDAKLAVVTRWLGIMVVGAFGGLLLGRFVAGDNLRPSNDRDFSYAQYSGNPDALTGDIVPVAECDGCADSYGAAARLNAAHTQRMDGAFRKLGMVEADATPPSDGYRYGGSFDDVRAAVTAAQRAPASPEPDDVLAAERAPKVDPSIGSDTP